MFSTGPLFSSDKLPDSIGKLKKLETLSISRNPINKLPASIKSCKSLQTLKASNCLFQTFPAEVIHLGKLDAVDFSHNTIRKIPEDISSITVVEINLNFNKVSGVVHDCTCNCLLVVYDALYLFKAFTDCYVCQYKGRSSKTLLIFHRKKSFLFTLTSALYAVEQW